MSLFKFHLNIARPEIAENFQVYLVLQKHSNKKLKTRHYAKANFEMNSIVC